MSGKENVLRREMVSANTFKARVKAFLKTNPDATEDEMQDFCDELLPPTAYAANAWLIAETMGWFRFMREQRLAAERFVDAPDQTFGDLLDEEDGRD